MCRDASPLFQGEFTEARGPASEFAFYRILSKEKSHVVSPSSLEGFYLKKKIFFLARSLNNLVTEKEKGRHHSIRLTDEEIKAYVKVFYLSIRDRFTTTFIYRCSSWKINFSAGIAYFGDSPHCPVFAGKTS